MSGDLTLYKPGSEASATLVADSGGNVPDRGDALEVAGENASGPEVTAVTSGNTFVGTLKERPPDFDDAVSYGAGERVGEVTVNVRHYVDWLNEDDANPVAAGDQAVMDTAGVRPYDTAGGDTADMVVGQVWTTNAKDEGTGGKAAVVRQRR